MSKEIRNPTPRSIAYRVAFVVGCCLAAALSQAVGADKGNKADQREKIAELMEVIGRSDR